MKNKLGLMLCILLATACTAPEKPEDIHIRNVENGLVEVRFGPVEQDSPPLTDLSLADRMDFYKIPGVSMAVIDNGGIAWAKAYGVINIETGIETTPESLFEAASTTKLLVAALALHFVEKGLLDLDADVNTGLKKWKIGENEFTREKAVTLRLLLSHRAGINRPEGGFSAEEGTAPTLVQVLNGEPPAKNLPAEVEFVPGTKWSYSNLGYILVQYILEEATGRPLAELAEEIIFKPLGMANSSLIYPLPEGWRGREIAPHDDEGKAHKPEMHPTAVAPGGLVTTPSDLALFAAELMKAWQGESNLILSRETVRRMFQPVMKLDPSPLGFPMAQALGVFIFSAGESMSFCHPGDNYPGASSWLIGFPATGKGAVIMTNGAKGNLIALEVLGALEKEYNWPPFKM